MLFNSFDFGLFLVIVYLLYWLLGAKNRTPQNVFLLVSSYFFYGLWDWRFLLLIIASSLIDFFAGKAIFATSRLSTKKIYLWISLLWNLGVLFTFKYFNFFIENFTNLFGLDIPESGYSFINVIIPVGLSFYTFQTMSYTIDVYRGRIKATNNLLEFLCFVSFFPQLVAGPIERARMLLVQFEKNRKFNFQETKEGLRQILWGLFKKMVVADNVAIVVNTYFDTPQDYGSLTILYAATLFFFQIYCDFSGYSDIAIGTAKLFGFKLSKNFNIPYLAKTASEYWQRWHITLTRWFTDYVYGPIIKSTNNSYLMKTISLIITMILIGLWHGANWTFVIFGLFQAVFIALERIKWVRKGKTYSLHKGLNKAPIIINILYIAPLIIGAGIIFRSRDIDHAIQIYERIFSFTASPNFSLVIGFKICVVFILIAAEILTRFKNYPLLELEKYINRPMRWVIYYALIFIIFRYAGPKEQFIYFQF